MTSSIGGTAAMDRPQRQLSGTEGAGGAFVWPAFLVLDTFKKFNE